MSHEESYYIRKGKEKYTCMTLMRSRFTDHEITGKELKDWFLQLQKESKRGFLTEMTGRELKNLARQAGYEIKQ